tara:strand:+ start:1047 stop:1595 length:549 start_codon:yes stop_codon:yes gene_type:complete
MGATEANATIKASNINEAWEQAVENANEYSGHQEGYSGDLNTCDFTRDLTSKLKSMSETELKIYIYEKCPKWEAWGYCRKKPILNKNKIKTVVKTNPQKGTRIWKTVYQGKNRYGDIVVTSDSQTECIKKVRAYVEKNPMYPIDIVISKVITNGNTKCATVEYKKSSGETMGEYVFIGLAAC